MNRDTENPAARDRAWRDRVRRDYLEFWDQRVELQESLLSRYTGVKPVELAKVRRGRSISNLRSTYAVLYYHCGIESANPTQIPPRQIRMPDGTVLTRARSWNTEQYLRWLVGMGNPKPFHLLTADERGLVPNGASFITLELAEENIGYLLLTLYTLLTQGTPADRDSFVEEHKAQLIRLDEAVNTLLLPRGERERVISLESTFDLRTLMRELEESFNG